MITGEFLRFMPIQVSFMINLDHQDLIIKVSQNKQLFNSVQNKNKTKWENGPKKHHIIGTIQE